eukprot:5618958-Prymnesium_polylepis.1
MAACAVTPRVWRPARERASRGLQPMGGIRADEMVIIFHWRLRGHARRMLLAIGHEMIAVGPSYPISNGSHGSRGSRGSHGSRGSNGSQCKSPPGGEIGRGRARRGEAWRDGRGVARWGEIGSSGLDCDMITDPMIAGIHQ